MNSKISTTVLLGLALSFATPSWTVAADLTQLVAETAKWESNQSQEPLRQFEQLVRDSNASKKQRAALEAALIKLLVPESTFEARRFACQQLSVIGSDASVPALAKLLKSDETTGIACLAFGNRPSAKANAALRAAMPAAQGQGRLQIVSTLGNRRDARAVKPLAKLARDHNFALAQTAIRALGMIGNDSACQVLAALRKESNPALALAVGEASLRCAAHLAAAGNTNAAAAVCEEFLAPSRPAQLRRGAFIALVGLDQDGGVQGILQTIRGSDAVLKPVAITAVRSVRSGNASEVFGRELPRLSNQEQIWLIESLAARADAPARAAIIGCLESEDAGVRRAAASALADIGGATAVRPLAGAIANAKDADEVRALASALGSLPADRDIDKAIIAEIKAAQDETRARLISALATRRSPPIINALFAEAENSDAAVATSAYRVLGRAATGEYLPKLVKQYALLPETDLRADVEAFMEQAVTGTEDVSIRSKAVLDALPLAKGHSARCGMFALLPAVGDAPALAAMLEVINGTNVRERDCAVYAFSQWPNSAAWDAMYGLFRNPPHEAYRSLMLRSLVRLAGDANANPDDKLIGRYRDLLAGARDATDLKQILSALGGAAHPDALTLVTTLRDSPGVQAEADVAIKKITEALEAKKAKAAK